MSDHFVHKDTFDLLVAAHDKTREIAVAAKGELNNHEVECTKRHGILNAKLDEQKRIGETNMAQILAVKAALDDAKKAGKKRTWALVGVCAVLALLVVGTGDAETLKIILQILKILG